LTKYQRKSGAVFTQADEIFVSPITRTITMDGAKGHKWIFAPGDFLVLYFDKDKQTQHTFMRATALAENFTPVNGALPAATNPMAASPGDEFV